MNKEEEEEFGDIAKTSSKSKTSTYDSLPIETIENAIDESSKSKIHDMLLAIEKNHLKSN